jgi:hypothetical protein
MPSSRRIVSGRRTQSPCERQAASCPTALWMRPQITASSDALLEVFPDTYRSAYFQIRGVTGTAKDVLFTEGHAEVFTLSERLGEARRIDKVTSVVVKDGVDLSALPALFGCGQRPEAGPVSAAETRDHEVPPAGLRRRRHHDAQFKLDRVSCGSVPQIGELSLSDLLLSAVGCNHPPAEAR